MAEVGLPDRRRLLLDSGGVIGLAKGNAEVRARLERARREGYLVAISTPVIAEVYRGGRDHAAVDRVLKAVDAALPTSEQTAKLAGILQAAAGLNDPVDAIVAAEALESLPAVILTSDPDHICSLLETQSDHRRVQVFRA